MRAAYRNSSEPRSENSVPCRQPAISPSLRLEIRQQRSSARFSVGEVCSNLEQLCEMGLLEPHRDEFNIVRYKPTGGRVA
jgi:hypothetical protein